MIPQGGTETLLPQLHTWYRESGRHNLPWRLTREPYRVLVSEVMLQQTQVDRVLPRYEVWVERWPTAVALAAESPAEVIREWSGLGYNRRALALHRAARAIAASGFPGSVDGLLALPGVGDYTAAAVASFALEQPVAVVDTNIARVFARFRFGATNQRAVLPRQLRDAATEALPAEGTRDHNLALMDLGAMVCTARTPVCASCPVAAGCEWLRRGRPAAEEPRKAAMPFEETSRFARGRIVEVLRDQTTADEWALKAVLPERHHASLPKYLSGLLKDGLIEARGNGWWALAGETVPARAG